MRIYYSLKPEVVETSTDEEFGLSDEDTNNPKALIGHRNAFT